MAKSAAQLLYGPVLVHWFIHQATHLECGVGWVMRDPDPVTAIMFSRLAHPACSHFLLLDCNCSVAQAEMSSCYKTTNITKTQRNSEG